MEYEEFVAFATQEKLTGVSQAEFEAYVKGKLWSPRTSVRMITNARAKAAREASMVKEVHVGFPLGGSDFTYKGVSLEATKMQKIPFLTDSGIIELSNFGHYAGKHCVETEVEVEVTESDGRGGATYTNRTIRDVRRMTDVVIPLDRLIGMARHFSELTVEDLFSYQVVWGRVTKVEENAHFSDGAKVGTYPFVHEKKPSASFVFQRSGLYARASVGPARLSDPVLLIEDGADILETLSEDTVNAAFVGMPIIVVGRIRKVDVQDRGDFITIGATLVMEMKDGQVPEEPAEGDGRASPQSRFDLSGSTPAPSVSVAGVAAPAQSVERVQEALNRLKTKISEGRELLGDEFSVQGLYDLGLIPASVPEATVQKLIEQLNAEQ